MKIGGPLPQDTKISPQRHQDNKVHEEPLQVPICLCVFVARFSCLFVAINNSPEDYLLFLPDLSDDSLTTSRVFNTFLSGTGSWLSLDLNSICRINNFAAS